MLQARVARVPLIQGGFVELASTIDAAYVVTLDRVACSAPGNEPEWSGSGVMSGTVHVFGWHKVEDAFVRPRDSASVYV